MPPKVPGGRQGRSEVEVGVSGRGCGGDRGEDIWVWEGILVALHLISEVRLGELKRLGIWRWRRRENRTRGKEGGREWWDKEGVGGAARVTGNGLWIGWSECLS